MTKVVGSVSNSQVRTKRTVFPSLKVIDPANIGDQQLTSHKQAKEHETRRLQAEAAKKAKKSSHAKPLLPTPQSSLLETLNSEEDVSDGIKDVPQSQGELTVNVNSCPI